MQYFSTEKILEIIKKKYFKKFIKIPYIKNVINFVILAVL